MPIPILAMLAAGVLSVLWPGPKLDRLPPPSGGVFAPRFESVYEAPQVKAPLAIAGDQASTWK